MILNVINDIIFIGEYKMEEKINIQLNKVIDALNQNVRPKRIYLFGSCAYGQPNKDSDIDLCIITENDGQRKIEILRRARRALVDAVSMPVDLLVYEDEEFSKRAGLSTTFEHKIMNEGIVIYEQ